MKRIAVIPGDGIGVDVTREAMKVLGRVNETLGRQLEFTELDWGAEKYLREGITLPPGAFEMLRRDFDAILFGAVGDPHAERCGTNYRLRIRVRPEAPKNEDLHERQVERDGVCGRYLAALLQGGCGAISGNSDEPSLCGCADVAVCAAAERFSDRGHEQHVRRHCYGPGGGAAGRAGNGGVREYQSKWRV